MAQISKSKKTQKELALCMIKSYWHKKAAAEYDKILKENKHKIHDQDIVKSINQSSANNNWFCKLIKNILTNEGIGSHVFENEDELIYQVMDEMDKKMEELTI